MGGTLVHVICRQIDQGGKQIEGGQLREDCTYAHVIYMLNQTTNNKLIYVLWRARRYLSMSGRDCVQSIDSSSFQTRKIR